MEWSSSIVMTEHCAHGAANLSSTIYSNRYYPRLVGDAEFIDVACNVSISIETHRVSDQSLL